MASVTRRLVIQSARCPRRIQSRHICPSQQWQRPLSSTAARYEDSQDPKDPRDTKVNPELVRRGQEASKGMNHTHPSAEKPVLISKPGERVLTTAEPATHDPAASASLAQEARVKKAKAKKERKPKPTPEEVTAEQLQKLMADLDALNPENVREAERRGERGMGWSGNYKLEADEDFEIQPTKGKIGFWGLGEESLGPDEDYYGDDITSHGHGVLDEQRDLREYARMIAWELPLLNQLAKPFELPTAATPFRFRYTSYLGESHPAANKVVVEFSASDMPNLTPLQKDKLIKLAGPRYNPSTDIIKMSCEQFTTLPQNKRFLGDTISKLLAEARDGTDTFADVPFDFRHHKPKTRYEFPQEWNLTEQRKRELEERRRKARELEEERKFKGTLVDGNRVVEMALPFTAPEAEPVMVGAGPRGKMLR